MKIKVALGQRVIMKGWKKIKFYKIRMGDVIHTVIIKIWIMV